MKTLIKTPLLSLVFLMNAEAVEIPRYLSKSETLLNDLALITKEASWKNSIHAKFSQSEKNEVTIECSEDAITLNVTSIDNERTSTLYHGMYHLGFLFPHPRWQISPTEEDARLQCGKTFEWRPSYEKRGFHLHTMHPNEWVKGFLEGVGTIAEDTVRWLARNRQNAIDLNLLKKNWVAQAASVNEAFLLAKDFGIIRGVSNGAALRQQNSWSMIPTLKAITGKGAEKSLLNSLRRLEKHVDYDFLSMEFGTSEFTAVNYERAISWMELTHEEMIKQNKKLFSKIHVSTNQNSKEYGNFNFLVQHSNPDIGILPHTVMFYGLYDDNVPMYGNKNFHHLLDFIQKEKDQREVWYYPETSYWIAMDMDVPLLLTDYLVARAVDMKNLHHEGIEGHFNFSSGQELGYWLFDWTLALNTDLDNDFDPMIALKLLGEDEKTWKEIIDFQTHWIKDEQLIRILSFPNLQDEIAKKHRIHDRNTVKELSKSEELREEEIKKLEAAISELPNVTLVKNEELKTLLEITELRFHHALEVRRALRYKKKASERREHLDQAKEYRLAALEKMSLIERDYQRYPEAQNFERNSNPTAYQYGYLMPAATLHFWEREENQVRKNKYNPFYKNIYNFLDIIF